MRLVRPMARWQPLVLWSLGPLPQPCKPFLVLPPWHYSREGGRCKAENGDQAQAHAGLVPAILGTFTKHVPYPLAGAIGAAGEVAGAQFLPDHGRRGQEGGHWCAGAGEGSVETKRERLQPWEVCIPVTVPPTEAQLQPHQLALSVPLDQRTQSASSAEIRANLCQPRCREHGPAVRDTSLHIHLSSHRSCDSVPRRTAPPHPVCKPGNDSASLTQLCGPEDFTDTCGG